MTPDNFWPEILLPEYVPFDTRKGLPIFVTKGSQAVRSDKYEHYWDAVIRCMASAYSNYFFDYKALREVDVFFQTQLNNYLKNDQLILECGCGTGRLMYDFAEHYPDAQWLGGDYSYNMVRQAKSLLIDGDIAELDWTSRGFKKHSLQGKQLSNIRLCQFDATRLPFKNTTFNVLIQQFLLDRVNDPFALLQEAFRVIKPGGVFIMATPFNFQESHLWDHFGSFQKLSNTIKTVGFNILEESERLIQEEWIDSQGNKVVWVSSAWVLRR